MAKICPPITWEILKAHDQIQESALQESAPQVESKLNSVRVTRNQGPNLEGLRGVSFYHQFLNAALI